MAMEERAPMGTTRTSFGCLVDNYGANIYVLGGIVSKGEVSNLCEVYNVDTNEWRPIAAMNEKKLSCSAWIFNDTYLFVFGGYD